MQQMEEHIRKTLLIRSRKVQNRSTQWVQLNRKRTHFSGQSDRSQVTRKPIALRPTLLRRPLDFRPPRRRQYGRNREYRQQDERRVDRHQQRHGHPQPQDPANRGKQRHVHVVKHEYLIAEHRQPVKILRALLMRDHRDRCLQSCDMRLERDRNSVTETITRVLIVRRNQVAADKTRKIRSSLISWDHVDVLDIRQF